MTSNGEFGRAATKAAALIGKPLMPTSNGSRTPKTLLELLVPLMSESSRKAISRVGVERALMGHRAIIEAIERRNSSAAREAMGMHLQIVNEDLDD